MPKESESILVEKIGDLEDEIIDSLYSKVQHAQDIKHAILLLFEQNLITLPREERNKSIKRDFHILYRNPANKVMDIHTTLAVKYNLSHAMIQKILYDKN